MSREALEKRVVALERKLGARQRKPAPKRSSRQTLAAEITELERRLDAMSYMDEDAALEDDVDVGMDYMDDDMDVEEVGMDDLDMEPVVDDVEVVDEVVEPAMDDELDDELDEELVEDEELVDYCGLMASETKPGVEDRISQDYLSEVEGVAHGEELATDDSMLEAAPTRYRASREYVSRLKRASARLDKVADYLEQNGRTELAERIDRIADAIDARISSRRAQ